MAQRLNLVIFGATGFTGQSAVEEVHRISKTDKTLTWGIAGRSQAKLDKVIQDLQAKTGDDLSKIKTIIADVSDRDSLKEMTAQADVIINCCGPYRFYGEPVVKACVETKTSHVDVSGEPAYMEKMQLHYNEAAEKAGIYIVSACGFDSIPADMGVAYLQQKFEGQVNSAETYLTSYSVKPVSFGTAGIHYGTWESLIYGISSYKELGPLRRQLFPTKQPELIPKLKKRPLIHKSELDQGWYMPFGGSDKAVVYRSQRYMLEKEKKRPVQMNAYVGFPSLLTTLAILICVAIIAIFAMFSFGRKLLLKYPRLFSLGFISHEGPSEEVRKNTKFSVTVYGKGWDKDVKDIENTPPNKTMKVKVSGTDPGYGATCTCLVFSAITILKESKKMPGNGGVLAPGAAFYNTSLIENLNKNEVKFEVID